MKAKIIHIGNSLGIRIPKVFLEECNIQNEVLLERIDGNLIIKPLKNNVRQGWENEFKRMAKAGDDNLLINEFVENKFDSEAWEW